MLSDTLSNELQRYAIGPRIKALRLRKKLGLVQLAGHTGLSPAMLSKIERGQMVPTLPTLLRIGMVFGVGLDHFFNAEAEPLIAVVRKQQRLKFPNPPGDKQPAYLFESLDYPASNRRMEAFYAEFPVDAQSSDPHQHGSAEFIYVLSGRLAIKVNGREEALDAGDACISTRASPIATAASAANCTALIVTHES